MQKFTNYILAPGLLILAGFFQKIFLGSLFIDTHLIGDLIVFLSIAFGFCVTSLSIFATSKYVKKLYEVADPKKVSQTLLHTLVAKYKTGLLVILCSIIYLLIFELKLTNHSSGRILLSTPMALLIIPLIIANFYFAFSLLSILSKVVIQEVKE